MPYTELDPADLARDDEEAQEDATDAYLDRLNQHAPASATPLLTLDRLAGHIAEHRGEPEIRAW